MRLDQRVFGDVQDASGERIQRASDRCDVKQRCGQILWRISDRDGDDWRSMRTTDTSGAVLGTRIVGGAASLLRAVVTRHEDDEVARLEGEHTQQAGKQQPRHTRTIPLMRSYSTVA